MNELKTQVEQVVSAYNARLDKAIKDGINSYPKSNPEGINEKNYRSRLNLEIERGIESDAAIYSRVVDLGNFVLANFDKLSEEMIKSYLYLCQSVAKNMMAKSEGKDIGVSLHDLVSQTERIFIKFNNFSSKENEAQLAIVKNALDEGRVKVRSNLDLMKTNVEHISSLYVNNVERVTSYSEGEQSPDGAHERIDTVYYAAMNKVKDLLNFVATRLPEENDLGLLDDALRTSYDLCLKVGNMLTAGDISKFREANAELIREINKTRNDYYGGKVEDGETINANKVSNRRMVS